MHCHVAPSPAPSPALAWVPPSFQSYAGVIRRLGVITRRRKSMTRHLRRGAPVGQHPVLVVTVAPSMAFVAAMGVVVPTTTPALVASFAAFLATRPAAEAAAIVRSAKPAAGIRYVVRLGSPAPRCLAS